MPFSLFFPFSEARDASHAKDQGIAELDNVIAIELRERNIQLEEKLSCLILPYLLPPVVRDLTAKSRASDQQYVVLVCYCCGILKWRGSSIEMLFAHREAARLTQRRCWILRPR